MQIQVEADVAQKLFTGRKVVGTGSIVITHGTASRGIQLYADPNNSAIIYIGNSDLTPGTTPETDGFPLLAGKGLFLPIQDVSKIHIVSTEADQTIWFVVI